MPDHCDRCGSRLEPGAHWWPIGTPPDGASVLCGPCCELLAREWLRRERRLREAVRWRHLLHAAGR